MRPDKGQNERLSQLVAAMKQAPILVVGDIMLDRFVYGQVERISPESPVPVLSVAREEKMLGGAGNALANLKGLGAAGHIISLIGNDDDGLNIRRQVEALGFAAEGLLTDPGRPTIVKTRYLAGHQQLLRTDFEKKFSLSDTMAEKVLSTAGALMKNAKALVISDYGKGLLRADVVAGLIALANKVGIPVIVDPKGSNYLRYKGATAVTPNRKELSEATYGMPTASDEDVTAASSRIIESCEIKAVFATRSQDGISLIQAKAAPLHLRADHNIEVFDVSGAGDTVIATIAATLAAGGDLEDAAALANIAGGIVVTKVGTAPIRAEELLAAISGETAQGKRQAPLSDPQAALETVKRWRARGLKIGFTNGCFDILHKGHVSYLNDARAQCDRLIVALNCDSSVRLLKGADRPVHDEDSRAAVVGALGAVDLVVLFGAAKIGEDNTASALITLLKPDIYFKGGDYKPADIPEAPAVQAYGGSVAVMPSYDGHSTTKSVKRIKSVA